MGVIDSVKRNLLGLEKTEGFRFVRALAYVCEQDDLHSHCWTDSGLKLQIHISFGFISTVFQDHMCSQGGMRGALYLLGVSKICVYFSLPTLAGHL